MVEVGVWHIAVDQKTGVPIVILQEKTGTAKLPIWIGPTEASAIAMVLKGREFQRPLTHDLLATILRALGGRVTRVEIASLKDTTYFARIMIQRGNELVAVDARPSDSIAIAVRAEAPIFAAPELLTHELDDVLPATSSFAEEDTPTPRPPSKEERAERLRRRIENIDPEDFGRFSL